MSQDENPILLTNIAANEPHGTRFGDGINHYHKVDIPRIQKMQVKNIYVSCARGASFLLNYISLIINLRGKLHAQ